MKLKPIRNVDELRSAKDVLAGLIATQSAANDDDVEVLSLLIKQFESAHVRIEAPTPIAAIQFRMKERGMSPRDLEPFIGSRARVSEVLTGKRGLSIDMIRALHEGLGIPYESLISSREKYRSAEGTQSPVTEMNLNEGEMPSLFQYLVPTNAAVALHRKTRSQRASLKTDQRALAQWQSQVLMCAAAQQLNGEYQRSNLCEKAIRQLAIFSTVARGPLKAISALREKGIAVVVLASLPGTFLDGAAMLDPQGRPVIGLTLRHDRTDGFWFTLLHEVCHIHLHYDILRSERSSFVDDIEIRSDDLCERQADELARVSLIPESALSQVRWDHASTGDDITAVASRARVHVAVVAGRWQKDHQNYRKFSRLIERNTLCPLFDCAQADKD